MIIYFFSLLCYNFCTMVKTAPLHIVLTIMFLLLGLAMPLLPAGSYVWVSMLCPVLFGTLLCSILCGIPYAMIAGAAVPLLSGLLYGEAGTWIDALPMTLALTAGGLVSGIIYRQLTTSVGAGITGVLTFGIVLAATKVILCFRAGDYYTLDMFMNEAVTGIWPGLAACIVGIPVLTSIFRKAGIMRVLRHEKDER